MKIHTCNAGENPANIANLYGLTEENILSANIMGCGHPALGEELLILTPTRTYILKQGDSIERLCLRFGVRKCDILSGNPWIAEEGMTPGKCVSLKFDNKIYGMAPANGYLYQNFDEKRLLRALPYLTYVTVGCAAADEKNIKFIFDDTKLVPMLLKENKIPLLRIYDRIKRNYKSTSGGYIDKIINAATEHAYSGIVMSTEGICDFNSFGEFLIELRKAMIGCDLILILEVSPETPPEICELADGNILFYPKYALSPELSYNDGEREIYSNFATSSESAKCFIDISALAKSEKGFLPIEEALVYARHCDDGISKNSDSLICEFLDKKQGRIKFNSLENVKSTLDIIQEFGFMGASFDINRTPISHLLMYNMCFKTATHTYERAKEGCSRG